MPRDWKNDSEAIRRYCDCEWVGTATSAGGAIVHEFDNRLWRLAKRDPRCKLHGDDPSHDLPPEFP